MFLEPLISQRTAVCSRASPQMSCCGAKSLRVSVPPLNCFILVYDVILLIFLIKFLAHTLALPCLIGLTRVLVMTWSKLQFIVSLIPQRGPHVVSKSTLQSLMFAARASATIHKSMSMLDLFVTAGRPMPAGVTAISDLAYIFSFHWLSQGYEAKDHSEIVFCQI